MSITETARKFFEACETGGGWVECAQYCHDGATFSSQAEALAEIGPPTGKSVAADYVYAMDFDGDRIRGIAGAPACQAAAWCLMPTRTRGRRGDGSRRRGHATIVLRRRCGWARA